MKAAVPVLVILALLSALLLTGASANMLCSMTSSATPSSNEPLELIPPSKKERERQSPAKSEVR